jgi:hypothetical protein
MSNAYAVAGVTAVLQYLLYDNLTVFPVKGAAGQSPVVTAKAPDTIELTGSSAVLQINLFLYQVSPNAAWRNQGLPSLDSNGNRLTNAPLALDLHYLLTAYGTTDLEAEVLLGYALQVLHENPILPRNYIRTAFGNLNLNPPTVDTGNQIYAALSSCGLADQMEQLKITPAPMDSEEMSRFWMALQDHYRPTVTFEVTVVLVQSSLPGSSPLPVLTRGPINPLTRKETGILVQPSASPQGPVLANIQYPNSQTAALIGDTVTVTGTLMGDPGPQVLFSNDRLGIQETLQLTQASSNTALQFSLSDALPSDPSSTWPVGTYQLTVVLTPSTNPTTSNSLSFVLAPKITNLPISVSANSDGSATVQITCDPPVQPNQQVTLILGGNQFPAEPISSATNTPGFTLPASAFTLNQQYYVRLQVDGIDSFIVNQASTPPAFLTQATLEIT